MPKVFAGMKVIGADGVPVGTVEGRGRRPHQAHQADRGEGSHKGHSHYINEGLVADVEGNTVRLSASAAVAVSSRRRRSSQGRVGSQRVRSPKRPGRLADRAMDLPDLQRTEGLHHAGGGRAALRGARGGLLKGEQRSPDFLKITPRLAGGPPPFRIDGPIDLRGGKPARKAGCGDDPLNVGFLDILASEER